MRTSGVITAALFGMLLVGPAVLAGGCGPSKDLGPDGRSPDAQLQQDAAVEPDVEVTPDAVVTPDAGPTCTDTPEARTGTTLYLLDGKGQETGEPLQGGGNNLDIAAGSFDITPYLPAGTDPFFLRFTALDQGVEGALDRIFLNVLHP